MKIYLITVLMLFVSVASFGMVQEVPEVPNVDLSNTGVLILILTPFLVTAGTWLAKKAMPFLKSSKTLLLAVPIVAGIITWLSSYISGNDLSWVAQLLAGSGSVLIHQVYYYFSAQGKADREILRLHR